MKKNQEEMNIADNPLYHDTWKLLKKYRDVVWSLELSVQQVRSRFEIEYGSSIEDFLESVYVAGIDLSDRSIEHHAKCIERSHRMLKLLDTSIDLLRTKHKNGESYYWLLYFSFLSPHVFCQALFPEKSVKIPFFRTGNFPAFGETFSQAS